MESIQLWTRVGGVRLKEFLKRKEKVFEAEALKNKVLVTSSQTAFEIEYLVEISYTVEMK